MNICLYFQVHQPFRLKRYPVFDIGHNHEYFDDEKNLAVCQKVANKCYLPATALLLDLVKNHGVKVAFSISGTALDQFENYAPEVLKNFKKLAKTGKVEFLAETSHHSLAYLYDKQEFVSQVKQHHQRIEKLFGQSPSIFRNTELIYDDGVAQLAGKLGYKAVLAEGVHKILGKRSPNHVYQAKGGTKLLLRNYQLSDDIGFRFSDKKWEGWPLTPKKFASWAAANRGETINLFIDFETFGEHQWAESGIFAFLKNLPAELEKHGIGFHLPSDAIKADAKDTLEVKHPVSWADVDRDLSAWLGNDIQRAAQHHLYALLPKIKGNPELLEDWRKLTTSDHAYYMCTKWFADGDVHAYFNPYDSPYDCFIAFMNVLKDMQTRTGSKWIEVME